MILPRHGPPSPRDQQSPVIELDHNASTRPLPEVLDAMALALRDLWHNPSSAHRGGQAARSAIERARRQIAALVGARAHDVMLTSGASEALAWAIRGVLEPAFLRARAAGRQPPVVLAGAGEHPAVLETCRLLEARGQAKLVLLPLDPSGLLRTRSIDELSEDDAQGARLICCQWASHETGALQPIVDLSSAARRRCPSALVLADASQAAGKVPVDLGGPGDGPDLAVISPHKFYGPRGVGVLWHRPGVRLDPLIPGTQEFGRRGGTESTAAIVGAGVAAEAARAWLADPGGASRSSRVRDRLESALLGSIPGSRVNGPGPERRLWNTCNILVPGVENEPLLMFLSERGVNASAGSACASGSIEPSPVLLAMGLPEHEARCSVRLSISRQTTADEVDRAAAIITDAVRQLRGIAG